MFEPPTATEAEPTDGFDVSYAIADREACREAIKRADFLMYAADNFSDRSAMQAAAEAMRRVEEREDRLLGFFQAVAVSVRSEPTGVMETLVAHVAETFDPEWALPPVDVKIRPEEDE
jgi:hypothetical protein